MKPTVLVFAFAVLLGLAAPANAQEGHQAPHTHMHEAMNAGEKLGKVNFKISCSPAAQKQFNRAVAWLHSFEYEESEKAFGEVAATDPKCGMAYWGVAMSNYHPLWAQPTKVELQKGWTAVEKARSAGAATARERDYIAALEKFFANPDKLDHRARVFAFSDAMEQLHARYPTDGEAGIFYALTLIATGTMARDGSFTREKKATQILNRALAVEPQHPGVTHYLIHGYDYPELAHFALPAARSYAKIAPSSAHALHMPSHIFTRLGLWQEAVASNLDAEASAKAYALRHNNPGAWDEQFHAMDYLAYAYLQSAQDNKAWGVLDELNHITKVEPQNFKVAYAAAAIPARYALERRRWDEAVKVSVPTLGSFPWQKFSWAEANIHFARAVGSARLGDKTTAREECETLARINEGLRKDGSEWAVPVEIERQVAQAWLEYAEGKHEASLALMQAAAGMEDSTEKHPVTPGSILPAREQLGELLLELKQPQEALRAFETALVSAPNRFNGLYGAARSARLAADQKKARSYYGKLLQLTRQSDSVRPEIGEARTFLANTRDAAHSRQLKRN